MATVTQLHPDDRLEKFEEFWKWYPHHPGRRSKADARALYMEITSPGGTTCRCKPRGSDQFEDRHREATPEEIFEGVKFFRSGLARDDNYKPDTTLVEDACVWLRNGRWEF